MAKPRKSDPNPGHSARAMEGNEMSEKNTAAAAAPAAIAPLALPEKINEASVSYSEWLTARGIALDPATVQAFWNFENVWRTSPERVTERDARKAEREAAAAKAKAERDEAKKARLVAQRAALAKKAAELGLSIES